MSRLPDAPDAPPSPREDLAARLKRQPREAEEALGPEGRIRLALTPGLKGPCARQAGAPLTGDPIDGAMAVAEQFSDAFARCGHRLALIGAAALGGELIPIPGRRPGVIGVAALVLLKLAAARPVCRTCAAREHPEGRRGAL